MTLMLHLTWEKTTTTPPFEIPTGGGVFCTTFEDPEKNILQLYGEK